MTSFLILFVLMAPFFPKTPLLILFMHPEDIIITLVAPACFGNQAFRQIIWISVIIEHHAPRSFVQTTNAHWIKSPRVSVVLLSTFKEACVSSVRSRLSQNVSVHSAVEDKPSLSISHVWLWTRPQNAPEHITVYPQSTVVCECNQLIFPFEMFCLLLNWL